MRPDFSLSPVPLLFFCPLLFGVNEPRNERDAAAEAEAAESDCERRTAARTPVALAEGHWQHVLCRRVPLGTEFTGTRHLVHR